MVSLHIQTLVVKSQCSIQETFPKTWYNGDGVLIFLLKGEALHNFSYRLKMVYK